MYWSTVTYHDYLISGPKPINFCDINMDEYITMDIHEAQPTSVDAAVKANSLESSQEVPCHSSAMPILSVR